jgi:predicted site-specific integrase-resolvase
MEEKRYYTDEEFCEMYGIDRRTAFRWRLKRYINFLVTPSGKIRYLQRHIDEYDKRNESRARKKLKAIRPPSPAGQQLVAD